MARELLMVIGGTIKHSVFRKVLSGKVVITNPEEFANYADSILKSISVLYVGNVIYLDLRKSAESKIHLGYFANTLHTL